MKVIAEFGRPSRESRYHVEQFSLASRTWFTTGRHKYRWAAIIAAAIDAAFGDMTRVVDTGVVA